MEEEDGHLNDASVVSKVEERESTMDPVEGDPPTEPDPLTNIMGRQLTAEAGPGDPVKDFGTSRDRPLRCEGLGWDFRGVSEGGEAGRSLGGQGEGLGSEDSVKERKGPRPN